MAVSLSLGFTDDYSPGFADLVADMEKAEAQANQLTGAMKQQNDSLREMAKQHQESARAMAGAKEASGSTTVSLSKLREETKQLALTGDQARQAMGAIGGSLAGMPLKVAAVVLAFKGLQKGFQFISSDDATNQRIKDVTKDLLGLDAVWKELKPGLEAGWQRLRRNRDEMLGISKASRELSDALDKQADGWKKLGELRGDYEKEKASQNELRELSNIRTKEAIDNAIREQQARVTAVMTSEKATAEEKQKAGEKLLAYERRRDEIEQELRDKREEAIRQAAQREVEMRRNALDRERQMREQHHAEELRMREEAADKARRIQETIAEGERGTLLDLERQNTEFWKQRLSFHEGNAEKILELERASAKERHEITLRGAKSEEDVIRASYELERDLRDLDHQHAMRSEAAKVEAARKAAQAKIEAERQRIEGIKSLTQKDGKNLFEQQVSKQSPEAVLREIARRRFEEKQTPNMGAEAQRRLMRGLQMQVQRDAQAGKINPTQFQQVASDLAANQIMAANKAGAFNQDTMKVFSEQAKAFQQITQTQETLIQQQQQFKQYMEQVNGVAKGQSERARAQRRAMRG